MTGNWLIDGVVSGFLGLVAAPMFLEIALGWYFAGLRESSNG